MSKFNYKIRDQNSDIVEGILEAISEEAAQKFLTDNQYKVLSLKPAKEKTRFQEFLLRFERVNQTQFNFFVRQLATMLKAGVPMLSALQTLQSSSRDNKLRDVIEEVYRGVEKGNSFSESLSRHPRIFNPLFVSTVKSGEAIGELDTILLRLADILEEDYQTQNKLKAALRYPMFAGFTMLVAFLVATLFIIPRFKSLFSSFGAELPLPTVILLTASNAMVSYWYIVLAIVIALGFGAGYHYRTHHGRRFWDRLVLKMPIFGTFIQNAIFARFARMLGMMLKSGVNILMGLELIAEIVDNSVVSDSIIRLKEQVERGDSMADKMRQEGLYPVLIVQLVRAGEESGKMDELLLQIAGFYDAELAVMVKNVETMIEPFFIFVLGIFVTMLALGIFLPMWNLFAVIQKSAM